MVIKTPTKPRKNIDRDIFFVCNSALFQVILALVNSTEREIFIVYCQIVEVKMKRQLSAPASISPQKPLELLRNVVWLEGMSPEAVNFITSAARIKLFEAGDTITKQGEDLTGVYLIVSGMVKVCHPII